MYGDGKVGLPRGVHDRDAVRGQQQREDDQRIIADRLPRSITLQLRTLNGRPLEVVLDHLRRDERGDGAVERNLLQHHRNDDLRIVGRRIAREPRVVQLDAVAEHAALRGARLSRR